MVNDIFNQLRLSRREKERVMRELNNPNTKDKLALFIRQKMDRQLSFERSLSSQMIMGLR